MKRVLIVKTSSMGDVIHALPALTDAQKYFPELQFDWVVEPAFAEIPRWHHAVKDVFQAPIRRWRKNPWQSFKQGEWRMFLQQLRSVAYDVVIDAQGLLKSGLIAACARGPRYGYDYKSARGTFVSLSYHQTFAVSCQLHAVEKNRQLFAKIFGYPIPSQLPDYGIDRARLTPFSIEERSVIFLHGTTWPTKHWPEKYWWQLGALASAAGFQVLLPWGNAAEKARAQRISDYSKEQGISLLPQILPKLSLAQLTSIIAQAHGIVAVDTGLGHIAAAMMTPTLSLYGPTDPALTGAYGPNQKHLCVQAPCAPCLRRKCQKGENFAIMPPCFATLPPQLVWDELVKLMAHYQPLPIKIKAAQQHDDSIKIF